jgi:hypothetical protein
MKHYRELAEEANRLATENERLRAEIAQLRQHEALYIEALNVQLEQIRRLKDRRLWMPTGNGNDDD